MGGVDFPKPIDEYKVSDECGDAGTALKRGGALGGTAAVENYHTIEEFV